MPPPHEHTTSRLKYITLKIYRKYTELWIMYLEDILGELLGSQELEV